jgi:hypothetical protein
MQVIHALCPRERVFPLAQQFEEQFEGLDAFAVAASGLVYNQPVGFVVLTARERFDDEFLTELHTHPDVTGYSLFPLMDDEVFGLFGCELVNS